MVELQIVVLVVAGSSPVGHPSHKSQIPSARYQRGASLLARELSLTLARDRLSLFGSMDRHRRCWGILPMDPTVDLFGQSQFCPVVSSFWERILNDEHLRDRN